ncbi:MAG: tetratricopeptide repeat protein [Candidatus Sericytochromatia bacterium]
MIIPIIKSKFKITRLSDNYLSREHLLLRLKKSFDSDKKLTLVTGNAGFGKSSLVSEYIQKYTHNYFWYGLTENDSDIVIFINHFIKGLKLNFPNLVDTDFEMLISSSNYSDNVIQNILGILSENIYEKITDKIVIVIDDFQFMRNSEAVNKALEYMIDFFPENVQLILISRYVPNFKKIPQLRVRQQIEEIQAKDLKFTEDDILKIIPENILKDIPKDDINKIHQKTDGWIGIIILLIQTYNNKNEINNLLETNNDIFDYLATELFEVQEEEIKKFMLITSILPVIKESILTDLNILNYKDKLTYLKGINILSNLKENEYEYNPILKDFLKEKVKEKLSLEEQNKIYNDMANYFYNKSNLEKALEYYFLAYKYNEAEMIVVEISNDLINNNRTDTLNKILNSFPEEYIEKSANLQIYLGEIKRLWGNYSDAFNHFYKAEEIAIKSSDKTILAKAYIYESIIYASKGESKEELIDEAIKLLDEKDNKLLAFAYNTKGISYLFGEKIEESLSYFEKALKYYEESNDGTGQAKVLHNLGFAYTMLGSFEYAKNTYERSIKQAEATGKYPYVMTYNNIAIIYNYLGEFKDARFFAEKALSIANQLNYKRDISYAYWTLGMISVNTEDYLKAEDYFNTCLSLGIDIGDRQIQSYALSGLSEIARLQSKVNKALDLINEAIRRRDLPLENQGNLELLVQKTNILIDNKDFNQSKEYIEKYLLDKVKKLNYKYYLTYLYFYLSLIYENIDKKLSELYSKNTLDLIKENNYQFFLQQHKLITEYIKNNYDKKIEPEIKPQAEYKIKFYCFGEFKALIDNKQISNKDWSGFKTKLAVAYLLQNPKGVTKEQLANLLYPDTDITRTAINVILSRVRKAIEPELGKNETSKYIIFNDGKYFFNFASSYFVDTEEFNYLLREANENNNEDEKLLLFTKIIALYEGDFLNEFSSEFWVQIEKENFRRKIDKVFDQIFDIHYKKKNFEEIIKISEKELTLDRCSEKAFQRKIKAFIALNRKDEALKTYKIMKNILKVDLGVEPSQESYLLYQKLN